MSPDVVRRLLLSTWQHQGWRFAGDFETSMAKAEVKQIVDAAVVALCALEDYSADSVWRCFSKLTPSSCEVLAERLRAVADGAHASGAGFQADAAEG